jgi:hypothetical protein
MLFVTTFCVVGLLLLAVHYTKFLVSFLLCQLLNKVFPDSHLGSSHCCAVVPSEHMLLCSCTSSKLDPHNLCSYLVLNFTLHIAVLIFMNRRYFSEFPVESVLFTGICDLLNVVVCNSVCTVLS